MKHIDKVVTTLLFCLNIFVVVSTSIQIIQEIDIVVNIYLLFLSSFLMYQYAYMLGVTWAE